MINWARRPRATSRASPARTALGCSAAVACGAPASCTALGSMFMLADSYKAPRAASYISCRLRHFADLHALQLYRRSGLQAGGGLIKAQRISQTRAAVVAPRRALAVVQREDLVGGRLGCATWPRHWRSNCLPGGLLRDGLADGLRGRRRALGGSGVSKPMAPVTSCCREFSRTRMPCGPADTSIALASQNRVSS